MRTQLIGTALAVVAVGGALAVVHAGDADVGQAIGHGQINWTEKTVTANGRGAPDLKAANVAVARLGAERAAKRDAFRNILEAVRGMRVSGDTSAGDVMRGGATVKSKVEGVVRGFTVLDTKYYSDGGVDVIVQVPIDGALASALLPNAGTQPTDGAPADGITGLVINAKGLSATPALAPTLGDALGRELYGVARVSKAAVARHGVAGYTKSLDAALRDPRVAGKPLIVKPVRLVKSGTADMVISAEDAAKIQALGSVLGDAKVLIVTD